MTVHAILILTEDTPTPDVVNDVTTAHGNHSEVLAGQNQDFQQVDPLDVVAHCRGLWRYDSAESKTTILDDLENAILSTTSWYALYHHDCDHDAGSNLRTGCSWGAPERDYGTVPSEVTP